MKQSETDESIIERVRRGELAAFQPIVARYERKLGLYLTHVVGNPDEADDLVQNVFVKAYQHLGSFDMTRKFSSWIYRIAHNEAVNWLRSRARRPLTVSWEDIAEFPDDRVASEPQGDALERWIRQERREEVRQALTRLPKDQREILTLRYYLDQSYREIAETLGIPMNTVATRLNRAKKKLIMLIGRQ